MGGTKNVAAALDEVNKKCKYDMSGNHESPNTKSHREVKKNCFIYEGVRTARNAKWGYGESRPFQKIENVA